MPSELVGLMGDIEMVLVDSVARRDAAEQELLLVEVAQLEQRIGQLHNALALVADAIARGERFD